MQSHYDTWLEKPYQDQFKDNEKTEPEFEIEDEMEG